MHSQLETYIQQVETGLEALPPEFRECEVEEIRQHIEAMVATRIELGQSETAAVAETLAQFGKGRKVSAGLVRAYERCEPCLPGNILQAIVLNVTAGTILSSLRMNLLPIVAGSPFPLAQHYGFGLLIAAFAGWLTGAFFPRQAVKGVFIAHAISMVTIIATFCQTPSHSPEYQNYMIPAMGIGVVGAISGMLAATAGSTWRKTRLRRSRALN